jgi:hypothetical protein
MLKCRLKLNKNNKNVKDGASVPKTWYFKFSSKMVTKFIIGCDANILQPLGWNKRTFMIFIWWMIFSWFSTNKWCWVLRREGRIIVYKMKWNNINSLRMWYVQVSSVYGTITLCWETRGYRMCRAVSFTVCIWFEG